MQIDSEYLRIIRFEAGLDNDEVSQVVPIQVKLFDFKKLLLNVVCFISQKPTLIDIRTSEKSTDTHDLMTPETDIVLTNENIKEEPNKPSRRVKRETKTRKKTKKTTRKKNVEGKNGN